MALLFEHSNDDEQGKVVVIRYEGPKGGPGMPEMLTPTSAIMGAGLGNDCALLTGKKVFICPFCEILQLRFISVQTAASPAARTAFASVTYRQRRRRAAPSVWCGFVTSTLFSARSSKLKNFKF